MFVLFEMPLIVMLLEDKSNLFASNIPREAKSVVNAVEPPARLLVRVIVIILFDDKDSSMYIVIAIVELYS